MKDLRKIRAKIAFDEDYTLNGCYLCSSVNQFERVCSIERCDNLATYGTPTDDGYIQTCGKHVPKVKSKSQIRREAVQKRNTT